MKTISGHYDSVFSIAHNNRDFIPTNVNPRRSFLNYECVAAGHPVPSDLETPIGLSDFWARYKELSNTYWEDRSILRKRVYEDYQKHLALIKKYRQASRLITDDGISTILSLLFLPLLIPCGIYISYQMHQARSAYENIQHTQWLRDNEFKSAKLSFREAIKEQDKASGVEYLRLIDSVVKEMAQQADNYLVLAKDLSTAEIPPARFATLEEIYDKLYESSFREFQDRQRPCRRYNGTYLESLREGQKKHSQKYQQSKNTKRRKTVEAIEIVFGIGDMDNTGYEKANPDAQKAAMLLKDFCDHLMENPQMCFVTTKELENPCWKPPFKNGLIVLNLTVHCDEATPGVHLTCIPYSSGCKRGPIVQAAMGRAFTGMGYPSTWTDVLDESGNLVPKRNREGDIIYNEDGSIRYQQQPDKQGIIDWIEDQKSWIQKEMLKRYGWTREYKGSHPRGNLSTPDYKVARAKERRETLNREAQSELINYITHVRNLSVELQNNTEAFFKSASIADKILCYITHCNQSDYDRIANDAISFWNEFALQEEQTMLKRLKNKIQKAEERQQENSKNTNDPRSLHEHQTSH